MADLTPRDVTEFRDLFHRTTGRAIDDDASEQYARNLVQLVETVLRLDRGRPDVTPSHLPFTP